MRNYFAVSTSVGGFGEIGRVFPYVHACACAPAHGSLIIEKPTQPSHFANNLEVKPTYQWFFGGRVFRQSSQDGEIHPPESNLWRKRLKRPVLRVVALRSRPACAVASRPYDQPNTSAGPPSSQPCGRSDRGWRLRVLDRQLHHPIGRGRGARQSRPRLDRSRGHLRQADCMAAFKAIHQANVDTLAVIADMRSERGGVRKSLEPAAQTRLSQTVGSRDDATPPPLGTVFKVFRPTRHEAPRGLSSSSIDKRYTRTRVAHVVCTVERTSEGAR